MSDMVIDNLIKFIIGAAIVVTVLIALGFVFKNQVIDFFKGFAPSGMFLALK